MAISERATRVVVGAAAATMGLALCSFVPATTIHCHREAVGGSATCDVRSALLGVLTVDRQQVRGAREASVASEQGNRRHPGARQLVLSGDSGSTVPAGLREVKADEMTALVERLNAFFADGRPGQLPLRIVNWKANLIGGAMILLGLGVLASAAGAPAAPRSSR
jgi:hypothetical protein